MIVAGSGMILLSVAAVEPDRDRRIGLLEPPAPLIRQFYQAEIRRHQIPAPKILNPSQLLTPATLR
jgi:hypothetical protein